MWALKCPASVVDVGLGEFQDPSQEWSRALGAAA